MEFKNIVKLEIEMDKSKYMNLLFDPGHDMEEELSTNNSIIKNEYYRYSF